MRTQGRFVLIAVVILAVSAGLSGCWGKGKSSKGRDVEVNLENCPPVDIVYVMGTSSSMDTFAAEVCAKLQGVNAELIARGLSDVQSSIYGIINNDESVDFACIADNVLNVFGSDVPISGGTLDADEDWGPAGAIVAERFPWRPEALRIVVPISAEGAQDGGTGSDMTDADDTAAMDNLIGVALANNVVVSPMWGSNTYPAGSQTQTFLDALNNIANLTGGTVILNPDNLGSLDDALFNLIVAACEQYTPPVDPPDQTPD
jgi:hypothetical protein